MSAGRVLSPLQWSLVVLSGLISLLRGFGFHTVGYEDDIVILVGGLGEEVLPEILQEGLNLAKNWCEDTGHNFF